MATTLTTVIPMFVSMFAVAVPMAGIRMIARSQR